MLTNLSTDRSLWNKADTQALKKKEIKPWNQGKKSRNGKRKRRQAKKKSSSDQGITPRDKGK